MTNREFIQSKHCLPPKLAWWLQPSFSFDIQTVTLLVEPTWAYGRSWIALTRGTRIRLDPIWFYRCTTSSFFQIAAHELYHVGEYKRQGWWSHLWEWVWGIKASRATGVPYNHAVIPEESEAEACRQAVYRRLSQSTGWENLLDAEAT